MSNDPFKIPAKWNGLIILSVETTRGAELFNTSNDDINLIRFKDDDLAIGRYIIINGEQYKVKNIILHATDLAERKEEDIATPIHMQIRIITEEEGG